jgi:hypothetical protein
MILGAVWCPLERTPEIAMRLREIKQPICSQSRSNGRRSAAQVAFYQAILDYFFDDDDLHFRALIVPDKSKLRHADYQQTHDDWYYKMYFDMLKVILDPLTHYRIYLDIKDTRSAAKVAKLREVLSKRSMISRQIIEWIQRCVTEVQALQ